MLLQTDGQTDISSTWTAFAAEKPFKDIDLWNNYYKNCHYRGGHID